MLKCDVLIVGCGFSGAVLAERLATQLNLHSIIIDKRSHIAGNAYDSYTSHGILIHNYGPHYFRTNSDTVKNYLNNFTEWLPASYRVLSYTQNKYWPFPINLNTFEQWLGRASSTEEMASYFENNRIHFDKIENSEQFVLSKVGQTFYDLFYKNYTLKQWGQSATNLDPSVCGRIPIRTNRNANYFDDSFQALPKQGYTAMFERILKHPKIQIQLNTPWHIIQKHVQYRWLIFTGPIDEYFDYKLGRLPYRSLRFEFEHFNQPLVQPALQINYPNDFEYTRTVELKHITGQHLPCTTVVKEFPQPYTAHNDPYYPIPSPDSQELYQEYRQLSLQENNVFFVGRLARYRYYNMDQVVAMALTAFEKIKTKILNPTNAIQALDELD